jgi:fibronectin type 3 domain-containing protein/sugar lactone lactonase YvrE
MTRRRLPDTLLALLLLLCSAVAAGRAEAAIPGPKWLAGFPLRIGNSVALMWTPIPGATSYRLYRKTGDAPFREIYRGAANTYSDSAAPSETITYKVSGIVKDAESEMSAPGTIRKVEELRPPAFIGAIGSTGFITVRWSSPPGTMFSNVYRSESEQGDYMLVDSPQIETFTDRQVQPGKKYFYRVASVGKDGKESPRSAPIIAALRDAATGGSTAEKTVVLKLEGKGTFRGEELYELNQPAFVGFADSGEDLYVQERRGIQFFDQNGHYRNRITFDKSWGLAGGMAQDRDGSFLVPFFSERLIRRIDRMGKLVAVLRYPDYDEEKDRRARKPAPPRAVDKSQPEGVAKPPARFPNNPNQVAVDFQGNYWVVDGVRSQVVKFNDKGEELAVIGRPPGTFDEDELTESDLPTAKGIQFNPFDGKIYVVLGVTAQIKVVDPKSAKVVATFGGVGTTPGKFQGIGGLAFRKNGNILVLDHLTQSIKEFDPKHRYVGTHADLDERGGARLSSNLPSGIAFSETARRFYVTSPMGNRVYMFDIVASAAPAPSKPTPAN